MEYRKVTHSPDVLCCRACRYGGQLYKAAKTGLQGTGPEGKENNRKELIKCSWVSKSKRNL